MPIRKIILEKDNIYHIYNRWFEKQIIFRNKNDFERFMKTMIKYNKDFNWIKIYSYCFLPNHFHLIVSSNKSGLEISDFMRKIQQSYAMYFKLSSSPDLKKRWQVFEWRFKAKFIQDEEYLERCLAYVNFNSIKHEIVKSIDDYERTSYHQLANKDKINKYRDLVLDELEI
jgi:putative transposase